MPDGLLDGGVVSDDVPEEQLLQDEGRDGLEAGEDELDLAEPGGLGGVHGVDVLVEEDLGVALDGGDGYDVTETGLRPVGAIVRARAGGPVVLHIVLDH